MRIGVIFPQNEIGADPGLVRDYAQTAESLGYTHLLAYEHVLGASIQNRPDWRGPYTDKHLFHEPFVLFGYLAALTHRIELVTGVVVLPLRQTVLVAKQAAEVDVLCGGRLRLGIGVGWNHVEFEAMGQNFNDRGRRSEEQIELLKALWTQPVVTFKGRWHSVMEAGINPMPVQRPIPLWIGGTADVVLERIGRMADGWMPMMRPGETARAAIERLRAYTKGAGRDPNSVGVEGRVNLKDYDPGAWREQIEAWRDLGASHVSINTMGMGLPSPQAHIEIIRRIWEELDLAGMAGSSRP